MRIALALLFLVACKSSPRGGAKPDPDPGAGKPLPPITTPIGWEWSHAPRKATPRAKLPAALLPLVPRQGIYAAGGGLMSPPWRIVVELHEAGDATLRAAKSGKANAPSTDPLPEVTRTLDAATAREVVACADRAWREVREPNLSPTADYDEILIVAEDDNVFFLEGYGPLRGGAAAECLDQLRALRPESP